MYAYNNAESEVTSTEGRVKQFETLLERRLPFKKRVAGPVCAPS